MKINKRRIGVLHSMVLLLCMLISMTAYSQSAQSGKNVQIIEPPDLNRLCLFFTLVGVPVADPGVPGGGPWFAVEQAHPGYKEIYAALMIASVTGRTVTVITTGQALTACSNLARVNVVLLNP